CIANYWEHVQSRGWRVFSLRNSSNHSIVSAAVYPDRDGSLQFDQARSHQNNPVPARCEQAVADLLNHLEVGGRAMGSGANVTRDRDGVWKRIISVRKEIQWQGHTCYVDGANMLVMSN